MAQISPPQPISYTPPSLQNQAPQPAPQLVEQTQVVAATRVPFMDTAIGKTVKAAAWSLSAAFLASVIIWLQGDLSFNTFKVVVLIPSLNVLAVLLKNGVDPHVPNR